ncbi:MAG: orotate phosphoribosyltransferase [Marinilabiliales bacterium]|nr:MAG: orotate phosphoribosyltransferase [Marinilabiliales bacterium]
MILNETTALQTAKFLLQINAIKLNPANPFTWASGWKSPIYCDNRKILSYPEVRSDILNFFIEQINAEYPYIDAIAGVATAGIPMATLIADRMNLPLVYVRSSSKGHGLQNQIEGVLQEGQKVVVIEDLVSTGGSSLRAVDALRDAKANVLGMMAIFTYGFPKADENFANSNCKLFTLSDYSFLIKQAQIDGIVSEDQLDLLGEWRKSPDTWGI